MLAPKVIAAKWAVEGVAPNSPMSPATGAVPLQSAAVLMVVVSLLRIFTACTLDVPASRSRPAAQAKRGVQAEFFREGVGLRELWFFIFSV